MHNKKTICWDEFADFVEARADKAFKENPKRFNIYFYFPQDKQLKDNFHILMATGMYLKSGFVDSEKEQAYQFYNSEYDDQIEIRINKSIVERLEMIYDDTIKSDVCANLYLTNGLRVVIFDFDYEV